jgi:hypothetical protein
MAGFNLTEASNILKVFYLPPVREMLNNSTILLSRLEKDSTTQDVSGKNFTIPLHTGRNLSAGVGRDEGGTLPTAGNQKYANAIVPNKYIYGSVRVTGQVIAATKNNVGAFVRAIDSEMKGLLRDMKRDVNRQFHGNGTDAFAYWTGADDTSGTVVDDGNGYVFTHLPQGQAITMDLIDAGDNSTKRGDSIVVTLGDEAATGFDITWTGTVTSSADGDYLVREDTLGYQMMGIEGIIDSGNPPLLSGGLHGIDATSAANAYWKAQVQGSDSSKVDLSFQNMQKVLSKIAINSDFSESDVKFLLCSYQVRDKYVQLCTDERRFYNTMTLDGGFEAVSYNNKPLVPDSQCKHGRIYYIVPESLAIFRSADFDWMDRDGSVWDRVNGEDAYTATLFHYGDLGCKARNANGILKGILE